VLTIPHCKESLSRAYITAVVGRSRNNLIWNSCFDYGIDGSVRRLAQRGTRVRDTGQGFDFQAKSTVDWIPYGSDVHYDLDATAYNDLVSRTENAALPFLLILLCLSPDDTRWLNVSADQLILEKCAFWVKLIGPPTENTGTKRISIPTSNVFTPEAVITILHDIERGVMLP
jgi:hypothetical protein